MRKIITLFAVLAIAAMAGSASAAPILYSAAGQDVYLPNQVDVKSGNTVVQTFAPGWYTTMNITRIGQWAELGAPAHWISFADTGARAQGTLVVTPNITGVRSPTNYTALFSRKFNAQGNDWLHLRAVADDTMAIEMRDSGGNVVWHWDAVQEQQNPCAPGYDGPPVGCTPGAAVGDFLIPLTGGGDFTLDMYAMQTFYYQFGVEYTADLVPEPGSMMLLGTGLFGLAGALRRRIKR